MVSRHFKTQRGWLDFLAKRGQHGTSRVYEPLNEFFARERHFYYYTNFREANERYHNEIVVVPWEWKLEFARRIVDFHWRSRTKREREWIATNLAQGNGDLSFLQSFQLELRKNGSAWEYDFCTSGLSGPNHDWCKRKYVQSL